MNIDGREKGEWPACMRLFFVFCVKAGPSQSGIFFGFIPPGVEWEMSFFDARGLLISRVSAIFFWGGVVFCGVFCAFFPLFFFSRFSRALGPFCVLLLFYF